MYIIKLISNSTNINMTILTIMLIKFENVSCYIHNIFIKYVVSHHIHGTVLTTVPTFPQFPAYYRYVSISFYRHGFKYEALFEKLLSGKCKNRVG